MAPSTKVSYSCCRQQRLFEVPRPWRSGVCFAPSARSPTRASRPRRSNSHKVRKGTRGQTETCLSSRVGWRGQDASAKLRKYKLRKFKIHTKQQSTKIQDCYGMTKHHTRPRPAGSQSAGPCELSVPAPRRRRRRQASNATQRNATQQRIATSQQSQRRNPTQREARSEKAS